MSTLTRPTRTKPPADISDVLLRLLQQAHRRMDALGYPPANPRVAGDSSYLNTPTQEERTDG